MAVRGQRNEAESALKKLRDTEDVSTEIEAMQEEATAAGVQEKPKMGDMFKVTKTVENWENWNF